jgi:hypothetical protein
MFPTKVLLATDGSKLHATGDPVLACPPPRKET